MMSGGKNGQRVLFKPVRGFSYILGTLDLTFSKILPGDNVVVPCVTVLNSYVSFHDQKNYAVYIENTLA